MTVPRGSSTPTAIVEAIDLYRFFHAGDDETLALRGVSLRLYPGEVVAVTGAAPLVDGPPPERERRPEEIEGECGNVHVMSFRCQIGLVICSAAQI